MNCRVVCVSGTDGANMREVACGVAEGLGFALVDEEIVMRAAAEAGVEPRVVADVEKRRSFMERALDALASSSDATALAFAGGAGGFVHTRLQALWSSSVCRSAAPRASGPAHRVTFVIKL